jgi:hypothetical protein
MLRIQRAFALLAGIVLFAGSAEALPTPDHLQCFKIKDAATKAAYSADLQPTNLLFPAAAGCTIAVPAKLLCIDAVKSNVSPAPPGSPEGQPAQSYLCYKTRCPKTQPALSVTDQFGSHPITVKSTGLVCAPINTVPVSTSTTLAPATCSDGIDNGSETDVDCGGGTCPACGNGLQCLLASDCASANCSGGVCVALLANGSACAFDGECTSTRCVDGVCCDSACSSLCQACTAAKKGSGADGACGNISISTDPDSECSASSVSTCGSNGSCDGAGSCAFYPGGTVCASGSCSAGIQTGDGLCDGLGTCTPGSMAPCSPYVCDVTTCKTFCSEDGDCSIGNYCSGGNCVPKLTNGNVCVTASACQSGNCVDGFCCDTACSGLCAACSAMKKGAGSNGTCGNISAFTDPDSECLSTCNGSGACNP